MLAALMVSFVATVAQYFFLGSLAGILLPVSVVVLAWLSNNADPAPMAFITVLNGLLVAALLPGPVDGIIFGYVCLAAVLALAVNLKEKRPHYEAKSYNLLQFLILVSVGTICTTLFPVLLENTAGYTRMIIINSFLSVVVAVGLGLVAFAVNKRQSSGQNAQ